MKKLKISIVPHVNAICRLLNFKLARQVAKWASVAVVKTWKIWPSSVSITLNSSKIYFIPEIKYNKKDFIFLRFLLARIQQDEQIYSPNSRMCFLLTDRDIQYMFETIWNSQSILSANNDIYQLHFVRWKKDEEWTPWNTVLLTLDEAESHLKLTNLELVNYRKLNFFCKIIFLFV